MSRSIPSVMRIDIGCGNNKDPRADIGVDRLALPGVDVVCDFEDSDLPFEDRSVDLVIANHTLEHVENLEGLLREIHRVLRPEGRFEVIVPHFTNTLGYSDYTHRRFFGLYTFDYFSIEASKHWSVPRYDNSFSFRIRNRKILFRNFSFLAAPLEWLFNASDWAAYLYESKFAWFLPCFELHFSLERID